MYDKPENEMASSDLTSLLPKTSISDGNPEKNMPLLGLATQLSKSSSNDGAPTVPELSMSEVYKIQSIKGKGKGLIALGDIEKGARLLCEPPLLTTEGILSADQVESRIAAKFKGLSSPDQQLFLSLHNNFPGKQLFSGIVKTNALPLGSGSPVGGIFPTISRINHSCRPNTQHSWNSSIKHETIHAIRNIKKGEEITISYDLGGPSQSRRKHLKEQFGFDCTCELCSLPAEALKLSDDRQRQIQLLDEAVGDPIRVMTTPGDALADCHKLLLLFEAEGITDARVARLYYDAFQISITHGDQARASLFAKKAYESRIYLEGEDSADAQKMKSFSTNPSSHRNFGISQKWKQPKKRVPKNLNDLDFDRWLWRVGR